MPCCAVCYLSIELSPHLNATVLQAAYLHVLTDLIQSIGVAIAGMVRVGYMCVKPPDAYGDILSTVLSCPALTCLILLSLRIPLQ